MDTASIAPRSDADPPAKQAGHHAAKKKGGKSAAKPSGKLRCMTIADLDGRTLACRRAHSLVRTIESNLPPDQLTEGTRQLVQRAAVLGTYIESCEAQWLAGEDIELADYVLAVNAQRRVLATIPGALSRNARLVTTSLAETLAKLDREQSLTIENEETAE